jgi:hypothetical protein
LAVGSGDMPVVARRCIADAAGAEGADAATAAESCAAGSHGTELQAEARAATDALDPPHTWVPWVTVGGAAINQQQLGQAAQVARRVCEAYSGPRCVSLPHHSNLGTHRGGQWRFHLTAYVTRNEDAGTSRCCQ